jgi:hypothetical protein
VDASTDPPWAACPYAALCFFLLPRRWKSKGQRSKTLCRATWCYTS